MQLTSWIASFILLTGLLTHSIGGYCQIPNSRSKTLIADFRLRDVNGSFYDLSETQDAKGVILVFICNHCPMAKSYYGTLNSLQARFSKLGYPVVAINPMDSVQYEEESWNQMRLVAKSGKFNFPYLQDINQVVAQRLKVSYTPEAFVLTKANKLWRVSYQGAIDDGLSGKRKSGIEKAVSELLSHKPVSTPNMPTAGCAVYYRK